MIASGAPDRNPNHASAMADMALHLIKTVGKFVFAPNPKIKIKIRVGMHSGMVAGGVVGTKMPKYCLFVLDFNQGRNRTDRIYHGKHRRAQHDSGQRGNV